MEANLKRRSFLGLSTAPVEPDIRPPWALPETLFTEMCTQCGECLSACAENVITQDNNGFPQLDFSAASCSLCGDCSRVCQPGAIAQATRPAWMRVASIGDACLMKSGMDCRQCIDACPQAAIGFEPAPGFSFNISIDDNTCSGCGECVPSCPVQVVTIGNRSEEKSHAYQ